ncbi:hypothetical protein Ancab_007717 [Ancistrocladus abbreviatus]
MNLLTMWFQCLQWVFVFFSISAFAAPFKLQRLGTLQETLLRDAKTIPEFVSSEFETFYYEQTLDHFNYRPESYVTFNQRYLVNSKYWSGAKDSTPPIFVYFGAEAQIDDDLQGIGFLTENARQFSALLVYIEHRFYGKSVPYGLTMEEVVRNETVRGYFNSMQALEDYAEVILYLKNKLDAHYSPVIVIGGSYGGMLASWFRLKYPHVALGALASSAPILYFDDITPQDGYYSIVTKDFRETSENCYECIRKSWDEIDRVAQEPNGLSSLSEIFKTCTPLNKTSDLKDYLDSTYCDIAQYGRPPIYPVTTFCKAVDGANSTTDILHRIHMGVVAYQGASNCYDMKQYKYPTETNLGWGWQTCSEMVMPIGYGPNSPMFPAAPFSLESFEKSCQKNYSILPRPHWITSYYGGHAIKSVLRRFGSNIIFSNGLRDPYSSAGVLENISDSIVALYTEDGSHCMDILVPGETDPEWLVIQRKKEVVIIQEWIQIYYADLQHTKQGN